MNTRLIFLAAGIIAYLVIIYFARKKWPGFVRFFNRLALTLFVAFVVISFIVYLDLKDFQENFPGSNKMILFMADNNVKTGIIQVGENSTFVDAEIADLLSSYTKDSNYHGMLNSYYKIMIFNQSFLDDIEKVEIDLTIKNINKEQALQILVDDSYAVREAELLGTDIYNLRAYIFTMIINDYVFQPDRALYFLTQIKKRGIIIYPETPVFMLMKVVPLSWIQASAPSLEQKV